MFFLVEIFVDVGFLLLAGKSNSVNIPGTSVLKTQEIPQERKTHVSNSGWWEAVVDLKEEEIKSTYTYLFPGEPRRKETRLNLKNPWSLIMCIYTYPVVQSP